MQIEYKIDNGKKFVVLKRYWRNTKKGDTPRTEPCPFCDSRHHHGDGDGHRVSHCSNDTRSITDEDGTTYTSADGYYLVEIK